MSDLKTISGLENLGRCVDLVYLDPLDIVTSCKNVRAIFFKGGSDTYPQGGYEVPKGVETGQPFKLRVAGGEDVMSNSYDFTHSFENSISIEGGFEGFEFSASQSVKNVQKQSEKRDEVFTYVFANSAIHIAGLVLDGVQSQYLSLNSDIKDRVKNLPVREGDKAYSDFIRDFGTHFLSQVALGGMAWSRVSCKKQAQSSSSEYEETFKTGATAEIESFKAGYSKSDSRSRVAEQDRKLGITRSQLNFVGGTGDVTEISSSWVESLDEKSVPIYEGLKLTRLSTLLTAKYFADGSDIAQKRELLDKATTAYLRQKGGDEGLRIRYGQPVRLESAYLRLLVYYDPTRKHFLICPSSSAPIPAGASPATFIISRLDGRTGDEVLTGDPVKLEIKGHETLAIGSVKNESGIGERATLVYKPQGGASGQDEKLSVRLRGSAQRYEGPEMREKQRPLVSGDIVMISHYAAGKGFTNLRSFTAEALGSFQARVWQNQDTLFAGTYTEGSGAHLNLWERGGCDFYVIKNV